MLYFDVNCKDIDFLFQFYCMQFFCICHLNFIWL
jgi:hypothetical protein